MVIPHKQTATTVFAIILLCLAGLGLIMSLAGLFMVHTVRDDVLPQSTYFIDAILSVISKIGLASVATCLIVRFRQTIAVTAVALTISLIDSAYYLFVMVRPMAEEFENARQIGFYVGAALTTVVSLFIYLGIFIYLVLPGTRREFGRISAPPPPPIPSIFSGDF